MKLLMHICCGPCAMFPVDYILKNDNKAEITGLFYNPNIHPQEEHKRRKYGAELMSEHYGIRTLYYDDYLEEVWQKMGGAENPARCDMCYTSRMNFTAQTAKLKGYDAFTTTLLVSPYQKHERIIKAAEAAAELYGVSFFYHDFREGFRTGQRMAKELGIYRQKYCGCCWSYPEVRLK